MKWRKSRHFSSHPSRAALRTVGRVVAWPFQLLSSAWRRLTRNWKYGKVRNLLLGLPAVGALAVALWMSALVRANPDSLRNKYVDEARRLKDAEEYGTAEIYLERIIDDFGSTDPDVRFLLAEVLVNTNRVERADGIFRELAPDDREGYPPAHRIRASAMAATLNAESTSAETRLVRWHLELADEQDSPRMAGAWAAYHLAIGQVDDAVERLETAVDEYPEANLLLGELYVGQGDLEKARASFESALKFLRERLDDEPENHGVRIILANTLLRLFQFQECEQVLLDGLRIDSEGPYKQLLASLHVSLHDFLSQQEDVSSSELLRELNIALSYEPNLVNVYDRLVAYSQTSPEAREELIGILNGLIAAGEQSGLAHFTMSLLKWEDGDVDKCRFHLEQAYKRHPNVPFIANNLAWVVATEEPIDLDRGLEIINQVLEAVPNEPRFLDTRATILISLARWNEAYDDLELALVSVRDSQLKIELHQKMVTVCEQLALTDLAESHRELAESLQQQPAPVDVPADAPPEGAPSETESPNLDS
jgi:tetratricopeptide (TPR) repeat protein